MKFANRACVPVDIPDNHQLTSPVRDFIYPTSQAVSTYPIH